MVVLNRRNRGPFPNLIVRAEAQGSVNVMYVHDIRREIIKRTCESSIDGWLRVKQRDRNGMYRLLQIHDIGIVECDADFVGNDPNGMPAGSLVLHELEAIDFRTT